MRILLVEDDAILKDGISRTLKQSGHAVDWLDNGQDADLALLTHEYDLVVLDLGLPRLDGTEVLRRLRWRKKNTPVLILSARDSIQDRVTGLDLGADDYLTKPFDLAELEARVRALLRRGQAEFFHFGSLRFDSVGKQAYVDQQALNLSSREFSVLEILLQRAGRVVGKEQLADKLCGWDEEVGANAIEVYIHRLRKKLEPAQLTIRTIRGLGYLLEKPDVGG